MVISTIVLLIAIIVLLVIGLVNFLVPLFQERRRGKNAFRGIAGIKPHWLVGHMKEVYCS